MKNYLRKSTKDGVAMLAALIAASAPGCGRDDAAGSMRTLRTEVVEGPAPDAPLRGPSYRFDFLEPTRREFRRGDEIGVRATMRIPDGEKPPASVQLLVRRGEVNVDSMALEPDGDDGSGTYRFDAKIKAPDRAGRYELALMAIKARAYYSEGREPQVRRATVTSQPLVITIREAR